MPVHDNSDLLLDRLASSGIACDRCPPAIPLPIVDTYSVTPTTVVLSDFSPMNSYLAQHQQEQQRQKPDTPSSMNDHATRSPAASFDHIPSTPATTMTAPQSQEVTGQLGIETSPTSPYYAPSPYYSPSSSSDSPSSYRESSCTPFSTVSESAPGAMFLHTDQLSQQQQQPVQQYQQQQYQQQQHYFPRDFTTTAVSSAAVTTTPRDKKKGHKNNKKRDTPPHQPLSMLSSVASLLPSHQRQHAYQAQGSVVIPTMIQTPQLRTQQPMHPAQSVCLFQSWDGSTHQHDFAPTQTPAPFPAPHTHLQCSGLMAIPLHSPFAWSMSLSMPTPAPNSSIGNSYPTSSKNGSYSDEACNVRTLPSNAPPLSPSADSYSSSFTRPIPISPLSNSAQFSSSSTRGFSFPPSNHPLSSSSFIQPFNPPPRNSISPPSIPPPTEQQLHQLYQFHQQVQTCDCSSQQKCDQSDPPPPLSRQTGGALMTPTDIGTPVDTVKDRDPSPETTATVDMYLSSENDDVKVEDFEHEEKLFLEAVEAAQERINLSPSRKRIRGPNAGVRRTAAELDGEEFADRGLARILVYADDSLRELVAQQNVKIREPHVYDADMMDLYCLSRGDGGQGHHFHTGDNCLKNQMGCRVALAVRYAYQSDLTETHLLWVDQVDRKSIPISIIMSFPACGNLIMRALKDDPSMGAQYRILCKQGYNDPPKASPREYGKIASLNRISWSIAYQNQSHMTTQAMGFLQRVSQAYQGAMGSPSRGMLKKRKLRAVVRESAVSSWE
ncbi:hypothetical protein BGW39_009790 [Mortierella sp. 14UC]|nr:hypothetical protein BGW39_009790 [Mortierella sp. 14UC]